MIPHRTTRLSIAVHVLLLVTLLFGTLLSDVLAQEQPTEIESEQAGQTVPPTDLEGNYIWTQWHPNQYSLAEDNEAIWIGAAGGVVRWDKTTRTHQRFMTPEGLPHQHVWAVAVDAAGNRWFGGDGGLSRLDTQNVWTHFTTENSGLFRNRVDAIAVGPDNTLWLSHDLSGGSVSRLNADGSWQWYPNPPTAVVMDYPLILQTVNSNRLWTLAGDEVWTKYQVYNGSTWAERTPPDFPLDPGSLVATRAGVVMAVANSDLYGSTLLRWQDKAWSTIYRPWSWATLAVGDDDTVWGGGYAIVMPYVGPRALIARVEAPASDVYSIDRIGSTVGLLPAAGQPWAIGAGWLRQPNGALYDFDDIPQYTDVNEVWLDADGLIQVHSEYKGVWSIPGQVQVVDDKGTAVLGDDEWHVSESANALFASDRSPAGDIWIASGDYGRIWQAYHLLRYHQGAWIEASWPFGARVRVTDIFAQDERHLWIAHAGGVSMLDDGGTPLETGDDTWTDYPLSTDGSAGTVAVDELGRIWYGNNSGLYYNEGGQWRLLPIPDVTDPAICDVIPAAGGVLFAQLADANKDCQVRNVSAILIRPNLTGFRSLDVVSMATTYAELIRTITHRNRLWTVTPTGETWFTFTRSSSVFGTEHILRRHDKSGITMFGLPFPSQSVRTIEVDANGHVWVVAESTLWRLTPRPDFDIPSVHMLLAPGLTSRRVVQVNSIEGYQEGIKLAVTGLPAGLTAQIEPDTVPAGAGFTLTVTADPAVGLGTYRAELAGVSAGGVHTQTLTLLVTAEIHDSFLPVVNK